MAFDARVIQIMIASPGDVSEERSIIRDVVHDWNDVNASRSSVMLAPVGWDTHSSPELGQRPQELINSRLLRDCDLLVAVFWTRLGTPTGEAESGSVEEIREHVRRGRPAMIYFSTRPVAPESIDPYQYSALQEFREECKEQGLIQLFDSAEDFRAKFSKELPIALQHNEYLKSLTRVTADAQQLRIGGRPDPQPVSLSDEAAKLLRVAAGAGAGRIAMISFIGGRIVQAGNENFGGESQRESAKWEAAVYELVENELAVKRGYKGEVFELTYLGWEVADSL